MNDAFFAGVILANVVLWSIVIIVMLRIIRSDRSALKQNPNPVPPNVPFNKLPKPPPPSKPVFR